MRAAGLDPAALTFTMTLPAEELRDGRIVAVGGLDLPGRGFHLVRHRDRHRSAAEWEFLRLALPGN